MKCCLNCFFIVFVLLCAFSLEGVFAEGLAEQNSDSKNSALVSFYTDSEMFGIKDVDGNILLPPQFEAVMPWMSDEIIDLTYTYVKKDDLWGIVRSDGFVISEPKWERIIAPSQMGRFHVSANDLWGLMDREGNLIFEVEYENPIEYYEEYRAAVIYEINTETGMAQYGVVNSEGDIIVPLEYDILHDISEERAFYYERKVDKWGVIDLEGNVITVPIYSGDGTLSFSSGYADVYMDELGGYIDLEGNLVIPLQYGSVSCFEGNYALVEDLMSGRYGIIDKNGEYVVEPVFYRAYIWDPSERTYRFCEEDMCEEYLIMTLEEAVGLYS